MKSILEKLVESPDEGFIFKSIIDETGECPWHFHPEYEIVLTLDTGYRIVGDNFTSLTSGDLVFLGPNLPHTFKCTNLESPKKHTDCLLIQFDEAALSPMFDLPAFVAVRHLLRRSALGVHFQGEDRDKVENLMRQMSTVNGIRRITLFLDILDILANADHSQPISNSAYVETADPYTEERINRVCQFINNNLHRQVTVSQVAKLIHLSEGAFSRFFRTHLGKTFPTMLNELRVGRACQYLAETDMPITQVAMECGYNNLSNFNRQFLKLKTMTPREFRKQF